LVEEFADFGELFGGGFFGGESLEDEFLGGTAEGAFEQMGDEPLLDGLLGKRGLVDVGTFRFIALDETFFGHDLEHLEDGGVAGVIMAREFRVDGADGGRAEAPKDAENGEFGIGRAWRRRFFHGELNMMRELLRIVS
jgi:hypothetical protein